MASNWIPCQMVSSLLAINKMDLVDFSEQVFNDIQNQAAPLLALLGFTRLLRQDYSEHLDGKAQHFLDRMEQAGRTLASGPLAEAIVAARLLDDRLGDGLLGGEADGQ